jgi:hypothetical protein
VVEVARVEARGVGRVEAALRREPRRPTVRRLRGTAGLVGSLLDPPYARPPSEGMTTNTTIGVRAMGMDNYTKHQQKIIKRYYENIDQISLQRLSELVADLYLSTGKKRDKLWESAAAAMEKLKIPADRIANVLAKKDPEMLARLVKELMGKE